VAQRELDVDPDRVLEILELRAYARLKAQNDDAKRPEDVPTGALADLVKEITVDLWRERKKTRGR